MRKRFSAIPPPCRQRIIGRSYITPTNANGHMSAFALGLMFGNEDKANWSKFWSFVKRNHPSVNALHKTILTDQDKGSIAAVKDVFTLAAQFMCAFHHRQSILTTCGGRKGNIPHNALWMFNQLCACNSINELEQKKPLQRATSNGLALSHEIAG